MRKRIQFWPSEGPEAPDPEVYCCVPEAYAGFRIIPEQAWADYEIALSAYRDACNKLQSQVLPAEPLNSEEIAALKEKCLEWVTDDEVRSLSWRRDLGESLLAPQIYGQEFVQQYGLTRDAWRALRNERKTLWNTTLEEVGPSSFADMEPPPDLVELIEANKNEIKALAEERISAYTKKEEIE